MSSCLVLYSEGSCVSCLGAGDTSTGRGIPRTFVSGRGGTFWASLPINDS